MPLCKNSIFDTIGQFVSTGGAEIDMAKRCGFHLHAETYIVSSGSSDSLRFNTVVGGLFRISIFSVGPKKNCRDWVSRGHVRFVHDPVTQVNP